MRPSLVLSAAALCCVPTLADAQRRTTLPALTPIPATTAGRLPRLVPAPAPRGPGVHDGWGWGGGPGSWDHRPGSPAGRAGYGLRRVQPLLIVVSPYASLYATSGFATSGYTTVTAQGGDVGESARPASGARVIDVPSATAPATSSDAAAASPVAVEWLRDGMLRLRWAGVESTVREVSLIVADSARQPLATQRVLRAPYTAVFERGARVAFVGASVVRADGSSTLTLVPLGAPPAGGR